MNHKRIPIGLIVSSNKEAESHLNMQCLVLAEIILVFAFGAFCAMVLCMQYL